MLKYLFYVIEPPAIGRRPSLRNQPRHDDLFFTNSTSSSHFEHGLFDKYEISVVFYLFILLKILLEQIQMI
jgi:hypothetical protein